ncbi:MAG: hypothetical protein ABGZ36_04535 [Actinomycetota bacterium]
MSSDIKLDQGDGTWVSVEATVLHTDASDLILDCTPRRSEAGGLRRALVHDTNDGLTINFNGDYPGGVTIHGLNNDLAIRVISQSGSAPKLPKVAQVGDLRLIRNLVRVNDEVVGDSVTLWLCVPGQAVSGASWAPVPLGEPVVGTE